LLIALLSSLRPKQWTKNALLFAGYLFTIQEGHTPGQLLRVVAAFALFCAVSGGSYLVNDVVDVECDRKHPRKRKRPIASGAVSVRAALVTASVLGVGGIAGSFALDIRFAGFALAYLVLMLAYSASLKHLVIVDLLTIAAGFVLRAVAGAVVIDVAISPWLVLCTTLLALFLGSAKRRSELLTLEKGGTDHRRTLGDYSAAMLDQMLGITASATLMSYCLYTFMPNPITGKPHEAMMITVPFVVYGLLRYLFLIQSRNAGSSPEVVLLEDRPMLVNVFLYVLAAIVALKLRF
jgi:4-hydroxybenzoate polyprenyltransferase